MTRMPNALSRAATRDADAAQAENAGHLAVEFNPGEGGRSTRPPAARRRPAARCGPPARSRRPRARRADDVGRWAVHHITPARVALPPRPRCPGRPRHARPPGDGGHGPAPPHRSWWRAHDDRVGRPGSAGQQRPGGQWPSVCRHVEVGSSRATAAGESSSAMRMNRCRLRRWASS